MKGFISIYVCICVCVYVYYILLCTCLCRHTTSACMFVCMRVYVHIHIYVYTCGMCAYYLCVQMHPCVFISENTKSSYVRFELLEDGKETSCLTWKTRLFKFKVI